MPVPLNPLLGFRSHFSLGESILTPKEIVKAAVEAKVSTVTVCDTMTVSSMVELTKAADKESIRPIVGVRLRMVDSLDRSKGSNKSSRFIKAFPKNEAGMKQIYWLLSKAFEDDHFYEVPRLAWEDLAAIEPGDLVWTTGDIDGIFGAPNCAGYLATMSQYIPREDTFIELVPVNTPFFDRFNAEAIVMAKRLNIEPLLTYPALYASGAHESFVVNMAIQKRGVLAKSFTMSVPHPTDWRPHDIGHVITSAQNAKDRIAQRYSGFQQEDLWKRALLNTDRFTSVAAYKWTKQKVSLPVMSPDPDKTLAEMCSAGAKTRLFTDVNGYQPTPAQVREVYLPRLKFELGVLKDLKFADYFLVVSHVVNWSKENGILVGPGRGSVGGSLVAYLIGITDVDPIRFGLLFERFINPSRNDLPDADLDFMSTRRGEVVAHIEERFGSDKVAGISNYGELGASSALRDVGRIFGRGNEEMAVAKLVPKQHGAPVDLETAAREVPAIEAWAGSNPDIWEHAFRLGGGARPDDKKLPKKPGVMRSFGKHAAGVIVSGTPLVERCVVERREGAKVSNWDMSVAEDCGLVKLDILGLSTLDTLGRCLSYIWDRHSKRIDLGKIPLDDPKTLEMFGAGKTQGIFQFEGGAARRLLKDMARKNPVTFDDLVAANALNRPGPIEAGLVKQYVDRKNEDEAVSFAHPKMEPALGSTFGVLCYQEQVMRVSVDLCGFSLSEADKLRKAMGKKDVALMASYRDQFINGADTISGMDRDAAGELFDVIQGFAGYCFNLSHAVEYSLISYQMAWLKCHYPVEFFAAALSTVKEDKLQPLLEEATRMGIEVLPPDINISGKEFVIATDTRLYIPINRVKGISDKVADAVIAARSADFYNSTEKVKVPGTRRSEERPIMVPCEAGRFASLDEFKARVPGRYCNIRAVETLEKIGAFHAIVPGSLPPNALERRRDQHELIPGLMANPVLIDRLPQGDKYAVVGLHNLVKDMDAQFPDVCNVRPMMGSRAKFVVVFDAPNRFDEGDKKFTASESFAPVLDALFKAGMKREDGYWTGLVKRVKEGSNLPFAMISDYAPYLEKELAILKPPLVITLGTNAARYLVPDTAKGSIFDYVGKVFYDRRRDCNILIGFTPGMIHFDPEKQDILNEVFERAASLIV